MAGLPTSVLDIGSRRSAPFLASLRAAIPDFLALTKPEVNFLIVIATFTGFYLGYPGDLHNFPVERMLNALCGTLLVASGTGTLNQYLEYRFDAQMRRTSRRPIAAGRVRPRVAAWFGISLSIVGSVYLLATVNALASALAVFTAITYLLIYTPLKRKTPLCTLVGAVPGAMPPLIGWAGASGSITSSKAWILYAVLFLWQFPHFMAIAWIYRDDYARAGYLIFPSKNASCFLAWLTGVPALALFIAGIGAVAANRGGILQYSATIVLGLGLLHCASRQIFLPSRIAARQLLKATIVYLPLQFLILIFRKG
jgi:protoheme IX farnesyltransferase